MDEITLLIVLFFLFFAGPWIIAILAFRRSSRFRSELESRLAQMTTRVFDLEQRLKRAESSGVRPAPAAAAPSAAETPAPRPAPVPADARPAVAPLPPVVPAPAARPDAPKQPEMQPWPKPAESPYFPRPTPASPLAPAAPPVSPSPASRQPAAAAAVTSTAATSAMRAPAPAKPAPPPAPPSKPRGIDFEQMLGGNVLAKLGVVILVLGMVFGVGTVWQVIPPLGKLAIGALVALALLLGGIFFEQRARYVVFGRAGIGGGWALLFFTAYASHHLPATQVITSQFAGLLVMLVVAAAMVWHTLRYDSQVVTGLAFLLAFSTVTISRVNAYSLSAGAVLAVGLCVIVVRRRWYELEIFGILASYLNHYLWLIRPVEQMHASGQRTFPEWTASTALLIIYWLAFRSSYVVRRVTDAMQEAVSTLAALLNTFVLLGLLKYQSTRPELAFYALLGLGSLELLLGQLPVTRKRRQAFIVLTTLGAALVVAAFPFKYSGNQLSILWLAAAQVLLVTGISLREVVFRRLGLLTALLTTGYMALVQALPGIFDPLQTGSAFAADPRLALVFGSAALALYVDAHVLRRRWSELFQHPFDSACASALSYIAGGMVLFATWAVGPGTHTALIWAVIVLALAFAGKALRAGELTDQAMLAAAAVFGRTVAVNFDARDQMFGVRSSLIVVPLVAGLLYAASHFIALTQDSVRSRIRPAYTWAATVLLTILIFKAAPEVWQAVWLAGFALTLAVLSRRLELRDLVLQTHVLSFLSVFMATFINLMSAGIAPALRNSSVAIVIGFLYAISQLLKASGPAGALYLRSFYTWPASALGAALVWYALPSLYVAVVWGLLGIALLEIGRFERWYALRPQGHVALVAAFTRMFFVNMNAAGEPGELLTVRLFTVLPLAAIFYFAYGQMLTLEQKSPFDESWRKRMELLHCTLGTVTLAALLRFEVPPLWVVVAWAALVTALLATHSLTSRRVFLAHALLMTIALAARTIFYNLFERSYFVAGDNLKAVGLACAILLVSLPFAFQARRRAAGAGMRILAHPEQTLFFIPVALLTTLLALELQSGYVTIAWGILGFAVFLFALWAGERSFRLAGLGLLMLCVGKILVIDVWRFSQRDKWLTFIVLGSALILVSYLYNRYSDTIRRYL